MQGGSISLRWLLGLPSSTCVSWRKRSQSIFIACLCLPLSPASHPPGLSRHPTSSTALLLNTPTRPVDSALRCKAQTNLHLLLLCRLILQREILPSFSLIQDEQMGVKNFLSHIVLLLPSYIETVKVADCLKPPEMVCFLKHDTVTSSISRTVSNCPEF